MSSSGAATRDGHHQGAPPVDLSSVFGAAAASLYRPRIRSRRRPGRARDPEPDPVEPATTEVDVPDSRSRRAPAVDAPAPRRRSRVVKVRDRQHVDMLLLAAVAAGPANGYELIDRVRERSAGAFVLPLRTVVHQLHRLANDRLLRAAGEGRARRYSLTPLGERVLATRQREWEAFSHGFNGVLDAAGARDDQRGRGARTRAG
jgi:DNA-binding PadR family transcriptional regulator